MTNNSNDTDTEAEVVESGEEQLPDPGNDPDASSSSGMLGGAGKMQQMRAMRNPEKHLPDLLVDSGLAAVYADIVNSIRADQARIASEIGVTVEEDKRMTPERAAELLTGVVAGNGGEMIEMFNAMALDRDAMLRELLGAEEYGRFDARKRNAMWTEPADAEAEPGENR